MNEEKIDYLKEDPAIPSQRFALVSMVEPTNKKLVSARESFFAAHFLKHFIEEHDKALKWKLDENELTDLMKEKLDISLENVKRLYYEHQKFNMDKIDNEFNLEQNKNDEPLISGFKIRKVYSNEMLMKSEISTFQKHEPAIDIYVAPIGKWIPYCPRSQTNITHEYANDKLNDVVSMQYKRMEDDTIEFDKRFATAFAKEEKEN